jgi:hypothetical protein
MRTPSLCLLALPLLLVLAGCGGGGGSGTTSESGAKTFNAPDVAFTFEIPEGLTQSNQDMDKVLARVSPDPSDVNSAIKIRQASAQELPHSAYLDQFRRQFQQQVGPVAKAMERHSDIQMGVLSFDQPVTLRGERTRVNSKSYFFTGGGKTWQLECVSTSKHKAKVDAACRQAIDSIKFEK